MPRFRKVPECLADVVYQVISDLELEQRFLVDIDIPGEIPIPAPLFPLTELVTALIQRATGSMEPGGEIAFVGWESAEACELEIADTGHGVIQRDCQLPPSSPLANADLRWQDCPQGGAAVTLRFAKRQSSRQAA